MNPLAKPLGLFTFTVITSLCAAQESRMPMHEHMQSMQQQMAAIRAETDPARRAELMQQHHASMREGMHMIMGSQTAGMTMEQRMASMEERMNMMGMMMEQMMEHHHPDAAPAADAAVPDAEHQH
ncbi:MAG TPA: hypothetical protein VGE69_08015 [Pseudomonadales bacterium]